MSNYIKIINWFWDEVPSAEGYKPLYGVLFLAIVDSINKNGWQPNTVIEYTPLIKKSRVSKEMYLEARKWLLQNKFIDLNEGKNNNKKASFSLGLAVGIPTARPNPEVEIPTARNIPEVEIPTSNPLPAVGIPTHYYINNKLLLLIGKNEKSILEISKLFEEDVGLKKSWEKNGLPAENFFLGIEIWMEQNHGDKYENFKAARIHFYRWIPFYKKEIDKKVKNGSTQKNYGKPGLFVSGKSKGGTIDDLQSLKRSSEWSDIDATAGRAEDNFSREEWAQAEIIK